MRFRLEKYAGSSSRYACPACEKPKTFTRYVDLETGRHLSEYVGRCNRENSCGYHKRPKEFLATEPNRPAHVAMRSRSQSRVSTTAMAGPPNGTKPSDELYTLSSEFLLESLEAMRFMNNHLLNFLLVRFRGEETKVLDAFKDYLIGTGLNGETVFWQIDERRRVRTGKIIMYDPETGKRRRDQNPNWIHAVLKRSGRISGTFRLNQCFFGQHLVSGNPNIPIAIVESEKSAIIATIFKSAFPDLIWVATGGKSGLTLEKLQRLASSRRILLYPDADAFDSWDRIAMASRKLGMDVRVSTFIQRLANSELVACGLDIADCLLDVKIKENHRTKGTSFRKQVL